ncbi:MAG: tRNA (guanosine(46)-N7)-methyltransferase TrmB [Erysipelotrichaceae bacterium]|nr:tRNA (guanosine(46)-N7)-methyltransferase TrmB [Erysipelotrichaceae bacterium]
MRMRKKKWAEPWLNEHSSYIYTDPEEEKGHWKELLHCQQLHLEIGMGKGDYLIHMAEMYPQDGWIGMEKDHSAAAVASRKALEKEPLHIENNRMICGYAEDLQKWFADGEIDVIHLNFSDPWPKKHAHKKRLSSSRFLDMYRFVLSENGCIRMKTDNKDLFEDSVLYFLQNDFRFSEFSVDYHRTDHPEDAITEYEAKFMALSQPIYQLCASPNRTGMLK